MLVIEHLASLFIALIKLEDGILPMSADNNQPDQKPYRAPTLNKLTPEEAQRLLESRAAAGDQEAKDLLDLLSSSSKET